MPNKITNHQSSATLIKPIFETFYNQFDFKHRNCYINFDRQLY